jgi:hypothetical protein
MLPMSSHLIVVGSGKGLGQPRSSRFSSMCSIPGQAEGTAPSKAPRRDGERGGGCPPQLYRFSSPSSAIWGPQLSNLGTTAILARMWSPKRRCSRCSTPHSTNTNDKLIKHATVQLGSSVTHTIPRYQCSCNTRPFACKDFVLTPHIRGVNPLSCRKVLRVGGRENKEEVVEPSRSRAGPLLTLPRRDFQPPPVMISCAANFAAQSITKSAASHECSQQEF